MHALRFWMYTTQLYDSTRQPASCPGELFSSVYLLARFPEPYLLTQVCVLIYNLPMSSRLRLHCCCPHRRDLPTSSCWCSHVVQRFPAPPAHLAYQRFSQRYSIIRIPWIRHYLPVDVYYSRIFVNYFGLKKKPLWSKENRPVCGKIDAVRIDVVGYTSNAFCRRALDRAWIV